MSKSNWYFKRSFIDPKNGDIRLYYLNVLGNSRVFITNANLEKHDFGDLPEGFPIDDVKERIETLIKEKQKPAITGYGFNYNK